MCCHMYTERVYEYLAVFYEHRVRKLIANNYNFFSMSSLDYYDLCDKI